MGKQQEKGIAFIKSNSCLPFLEKGQYNGYVAVPPGHQFYGKKYEEVDQYVSVHGGLTFSDFAAYREKTFVCETPIAKEAIF